MGKSDEDYTGPERREERNAKLRSGFDEIGDKFKDNPMLTEGDMNHMQYLLRYYYRRGHGSRSIDLIRPVKEEHADEISRAMLAMLDSVSGLRGGAV